MAPHSLAHQPLRDGEAAPARSLDRRDQATPRLSAYSFGAGRRKAVRRQEDREGSFVDVYGLRLFLLIGWVSLMNVADSFFTLVHLQMGGVELNPVAGALLGTGREGFVLAKSGLISLALVILCLHKNFTLARIGLIVAAAAYTALVCYHLALFRV